MFVCLYVCMYVCTYVCMYMLVKTVPGANPTIASYNASAVKNYNATRSLVSSENNIIFLHSLTYCNACVVIVNSEFVGLAPGLNIVSNMKLRSRVQRESLANESLS
jgi:hypothetical protein